MDPNATLTAIREALAKYPECNDHAASLLGDVTDYFEQLDEWLTNGGFMPEPWASMATLSPAHHQDAYASGVSDGREIGFSAGYTLAQHQMHQHLTSHGYTEAENTRNGSY